MRKIHLKNFFKNQYLIPIQPKIRPEFSKKMFQSASGSINRTTLPGSEISKTMYKKSISPFSSKNLNFVWILGFAVNNPLEK